jgi:hypothetical protein
MEVNILITLDLREQAALQAALVIHAAPDSLVSLALTGACRISSLNEIRELRSWLAHAISTSDGDCSAFEELERSLVHFGI